MSGSAAPFARVPDGAAFQALERAAGSHDGRVALTGLHGPARAVALTLLLARRRARALVVVPDDARMSDWSRDLAAAAALTGRDPRGILLFPALDADPYDDIPPHPEVTRERVRALGRLARGEVDVLLVPARALLTWLPSPPEIAAATRVIRVGDTLPPDTFLLDALRAGYRRAETVAAPGDISRRGGIVDIFPPEADEPVRIELFGDTVESLRAFDPDHQRSTGALARVAVGPAAENPASDTAVARLAAYLEGGAARARREDGPVLDFRAKIDALRESGFLPAFDALAALTAEAPATLFEHASGVLLVVDEPEKAE